MAKKSTDDADFIRDLTAARGHASAGMVMTKPPTGRSKTLDELLHDAGALDSPVAVAADGDQAAEATGAVGAETGQEPRSIAIDLIQRSPYQVRHIDEVAIEDLMESIQDTNGLITPIVVRKLQEGRYELIAGHTRLEACRLLGHSSIPAIVRDMDDSQAAKALAADNMTRKDLTDFEIFKQLNVLFANHYLRSNAEASRLLGKTRQDIIRYQSFGRLPADVIELLERDPALLGANLAKELADMTADGFETLVVEGCRRLFDGNIRTQGAVLSWIRQRSAEKPEKSEFRVVDSNGKSFARVAISGRSVRISGNGLDLEAVEALLREGLPKCRR